uniref:DUF4939 domain-containing protein n=1 Tax=Sander lucioperca TaxID=283035 RepID=A0A8C9YGB4_SANLU
RSPSHGSPLHPALLLHCPAFVPASSHPPPRLPSSPDSSAPSSAPLVPSPVSFPDKFSGVLGTCEGFLVQGALVFWRQTVTFHSDEAKVCFVAGLLCDKALAWFTSVSEGQPHLLSSYSAFEQEMRRVFDRPVRGTESASRLVSLRQGDRSVAEYSIDFCILAAP